MERIDFLDPRSGGGLGAELVSVACSLRTGSIWESHRRRPQRTGRSRLPPDDTPWRRSQRPSGDGATPGVLNQPVAHFLVVSARLDDAPGLPSLEVHAHHGKYGFSSK